MASNPETTYGNLQKNERYKKLLRALKLAYARDKLDLDGSSNDPTWPSLSSINGDTLDISFAGSSACSSRMESEVLASSNNMRNKHRRQTQQSHLVTSSVKQLSIPKTDEKERSLMPPPSNIVVTHLSKKKDSHRSMDSTMNININSAGSEQGNSASSNLISGIDKKFVGKNKQDLSKADNTKLSNEIYSESETEDKPDRCFSKWRTMLNANNQLVIKGTLQCGKVARSKPVIRRLSSNMVQSIFKHVYHLDGNLFDERHELPEYIRGKFYNGFPYDWENVYQIWKEYVVSGSNPNFRWPERIADSDDDLLSEVTNITYQKSSKSRLLNKKKMLTSDKQNPSESAEQVLKNSIRSDKELSNVSDLSVNQSHCRKPRLVNNKKMPTSDNQNPSESTEQVLKDSISSDKELPNVSDLSVNQSPCCCSKAGSVKASSIKSSRITSTSHEKYDLNSTIENFMRKTSTSKETSTLSTPSSERRVNRTPLTEIIHKDKLHKILAKLSNQNCSVEYIDKIIQMFEALKFFVSIESEDEDDFSNIANEIPSSSTGKQPAYQLQKNISKPEDTENSTIDKDILNNTILYDDSHSRHKNKKSYSKKRPSVRKKLTRSDYDSSDSSASNSEGEEKAKSSVQNLQKVNRELSVSFTDQEYNEGSINKSTENIKSQINKRILQETESRILQLPSKNSKEFSLEPCPKQNCDTNQCADKENQTTKSPVSSVIECKNIKISEKNHSNSASPEKRKMKPVIRKIENFSHNLKVQGIKKSQVTSSLTNNNPQIDNQQKIDDKLNPRNELPNQNSMPISTTKNKSNDIIEIDKKAAKKVNNEKSNDKAIEKKDYGSETNPKKLTNWIPQIKRMTTGDYGLVFEGRLLNEAAYVENLKFTTEIVSKRINSELIQTQDHVFYELVGNLSASKHQIPKEIQKFCLNGCPKSISSFCEKWQILKEKTQSNHDIDILNMPTSSKGRLRLPPLNFWDGERTSLKSGGKIVYSPGSSSKSQSSSSFDASQNSINENCNNNLPNLQKETRAEEKKLISKDEGIEIIAVNPVAPKESTTRKTRAMKKKEIKDKRQSYCKSSDEDMPIRLSRKRQCKGFKPIYVESDVDEFPTRLKRTKKVSQDTEDENKRKKGKINEESLQKERSKSVGRRSNNYEFKYSLRKNVIDKNDLSEDELSCM